MIALGTHYLPFIFLYGMCHFAALAAVLIGSGVLLGLYTQDAFALERLSSYLPPALRSI